MMLYDATYDAVYDSIYDPYSDSYSDPYRICIGFLYIPLIWCFCFLDVFLRTCANMVARIESGVNFCIFWYRLGPHVMDWDPILPPKPPEIKQYIYIYVFI